MTLLGAFREQSLTGDFEMSIEWCYIRHNHLNIFDTFFTFS